MIHFNSGTKNQSFACINRKETIQSFACDLLFVDCKLNPKDNFVLVGLDFLPNIARICEQIGAPAFSGNSYLLNLSQSASWDPGDAMSDPESQEEESIQKRENHVGEFIAGCICGCCCGSIGSFPLLAFNETTRKQKSFLAGFIFIGVVGLLVITTLVIVNYVTIVESSKE